MDAGPRPRGEEIELRATHESSLRFVPREFLGLLGRDRLMDVKFGDHVQRDMNVLFSDIRDYTALVEAQTTAEAFRIVNEHMTMLDAAIRARGGFIGNIEGDAVLALFAGSAEDAVRAGIEAHEQLRRLNAHRTGRGHATVAMGLAINTGPLLLGTIGSKERLQCDVIGDAVNVCARIESLTKLYGTAMLVSHVTRELLGDSISLREIDCVRVKGMRAPVTLYEVLDALEDEARLARRRTAASPPHEAYHVWQKILNPSMYTWTWSKFQVFEDDIPYVNRPWEVSADAVGEPIESQAAKLLKSGHPVCLP